MESHERRQPATDVEQDLGEPGASVEGAATDVEADLGRPGDAYSDEPPATDPTLR